MTTALEAYTEAKTRRAGNELMWWRAEIRAIERLTGVSQELMRGPSRAAPIVAARWMAIAALRARGWSLPRIGRELNRDHTTVLYALRRMGQANAT